MKHALMILDHFPPSFAPRMGYLAKYMKEMGWDARVFSVTHSTDTAKFDNLVGFVRAEVVPMPMYCNNHSFNRLTTEVLGMIKGGKCWSMNDDRMYKHIIKNIKGEKYDLVICSTASFFPLFTSLRVAQTMGLPLILDFRDIYEQDPYMYPRKGAAGLLRRMQIGMRNRIITHAAAVTTVSEWHKNLLVAYNENTHLIFNGFDNELFYPHTNTDRLSSFVIGYTGSVSPTNCEGSRNPEILFDAVQRLSAEGIIEPKKFAIHFYTDDVSKNYLRSTAEKYGIADYVKIYQWIAANEVPSVLSKCSILLVLVAACNTNGVMTTKIFEYLAMGRTTICVPNNNSPVAKLISDAKAGKSFDNSNELYLYLIDKYNEWKINRRIKCHTDMDYVAQFSRQKQAKQFVKIFEQAVEKKNTTQRVLIHSIIRTKKKKSQ
ncbi:MAG: glycosyltransferase [Bacteroidales bacterium]|nr:glycosyltransferase [Bacteroidales bacterium]